MENNREKGGRDKPRIPFMKQIIKYIGRTIYKELKVAVIDRDEIWWRSIGDIEPI